MIRSGDPYQAAGRVSYSWVNSVSCERRRALVGYRTAGGRLGSGVERAIEAAVAAGQGNTGA